MSVQPEQHSLPSALEEFLRDINPWWRDEPGPRLPDYHRWIFRTLLRKLENGLAPIVALRGPRQVGKTTLQMQLIEHYLQHGKVRPSGIFRVQFDEIPSLRGVVDPILTIARWYEHNVLGMTFNETAREGYPAFLFFDEVQKVRDWSPQLKALVDHHTVKVHVTGSSSLHIKASQDSLAGRITQVELGNLLTREIAELRFGRKLDPVLPSNGLEPLLQKDFWRDVQQSGLANREIRDMAFAAFSERGGFPMAQVRETASWPEVADQLNEVVINRTIQHDLGRSPQGPRRDPQLLEEVFKLACRYAGQSPSQAVYVDETRRALQGDIGWQRILTYLRYLDGAMLVKLVEPLELRLKKRRGSYKICLCDHSLRASWLQEVVPLTAQGLVENPNLADLAGHLVESVVGYYLGGIPHVDLAHFPERAAEPEVDFILTIGEHRIPMEIKYRRHIDPFRDTLGLRSFLEKTVYNAPFGILVTMLDDAMADDPRIVAISLPSLLLMR